MKTRIVEASQIELERLERFVSIPAHRKGFAIGGQCPGIKHTFFPISNLAAQCFEHLAAFHIPQADNLVIPHKKCAFYPLEATV